MPVALIVRVAVSSLALLLPTSALAPVTAGSSSPADVPVEPLVGSACTTTVSSSADLEDLIDSASGGDVICLQAGNYGSLTIDSARNSYVTVRSVIAHVAVFDSITLDDASFIRLEQLTVHGSISNGLDNTNNIQVVANDVEGVWVDAPSTNGAGPGPASWTIEFNDIHDCSDFCVALVSDNPEDYWPVTDITIRGNRIGPMDGGEDAIRIHNWQDVVIEDNEITGVIEDGQHNDCLQSVWGGDGLTFQGNYLHDNNCQTFFLKDGHTSNIVFHDNLSVRNRVGIGSCGRADLELERRVDREQHHLGRVRVLPEVRQRGRHVPRRPARGVRGHQQRVRGLRPLRRLRVGRQPRRGVHRPGCARGGLQSIRWRVDLGARAHGLAQRRGHHPGLRQRHDERRRRPGQR